jgi:hypothetical protein
MLCDGNTFTYGYIGSRATGNEAGDYMVVGPNWQGETPAGIKKVFRSTTQVFKKVFLNHGRGELQGKVQWAGCLHLDPAFDRHAQRGCPLHSQHLL